MTGASKYKEGSFPLYRVQIGRCLLQYQYRYRPHHLRRYRLRLLHHHPYRIIALRLSFLG
jgi:hypothetical protein